MIQSLPTGARAFVNGELVGATPVAYTVKSQEWHPPYRYRLELEGYEPAEGELYTPLAGGRIVASFFTLGLVAVLRPVHTFKDSYTVSLQRAQAPWEDASTLDDRLRYLRTLYERGELTEREYDYWKSMLLEGL